MNAPNTNPWVVQTPKQGAQVPVGSYFADYKGVEDKVIKDAAGVEAVKWLWTWAVTKGSEAGKVATALTDRSITTTALPGQLIAGLLGRQLVAGEDVKAALDACIGKSYLVTVQPGPKGGKPGVRMVGVPPQM